MKTRNGCSMSYKKRLIALSVEKMETSKKTSRKKVKKMQMTGHSRRI